MKEHAQTGWVDAVTAKISRVAMWMSAVIVAIIFYEVVARYIFASPTLWAYELSWWLAGVLYLLSGLYVMQQRAHIRITLVYDMLPRPLRRACDVVALVVLVAFCLAVVWGGYGEALAKLMRWEGLGSAWNPPIPATIKPLILITLVLLAVQAASNLYFDWREDADDRPDDSARLP